MGETVAEREPCYILTILGPRRCVAFQTLAISIITLSSLSGRIIEPKFVYSYHNAFNKTINGFGRKIDRPIGIPRSGLTMNVYLRVVRLLSHQYPFPSTSVLRQNGCV